jgi:DNA-binding NtrC family response regulator
MKPRILIVDDQERMADVIATALTSAGHECEISHDGSAALKLLEQRSFDALVTDWKMPRMDGLELLRRVKITYPALPVIVVTAYGSVSSAVTAMREGAFDYITKPFDNDELRATVARAIDMKRLERENLYLKQAVETRYSPDAIVAESAKSREVLEMVRRVAPSRAAVMIQGESGTGKELIARLLHYWSDRVGGPMVAVNCKAFAEGVLESELFGHEKGAFTGASSARAGCFERAHAGTLFLDEIAEVGVDFQAKLLRVIQEGEVLRVGGEHPRKVDVRIVAATNRALADEIVAGRFREDLYFRLNVIPIKLAPLRERPEDILALARHFLATHQADSGRQLAFNPEAEATLLAHRWPGNVRELENAIERAAILTRDNLITPEDLLLEEPRRSLSSSATGSLQDSIDQVVKSRIEAAIEAARGNRAEAARNLGIDRATLWRLLKRLGV